MGEFYSSSAAFRALGGFLGAGRLSGALGRLSGALGRLSGALGRLSGCWAAFRATLLLKIDTNRGQKTMARPESGTSPKSAPSRRSRPTRAPAAVSQPFSWPKGQPAPRPTYSHAVRAGADRRHWASWKSAGIGRVALSDVGGASFPVGVQLRRRNDGGLVRTQPVVGAGEQLTSPRRQPGPGVQQGDICC
jgi:hypothetical protein